MAPERPRGGDERDGVSLTNLDQPLFPDANATKRDLVDYLDAMSGPMISALRDRPLSVIRVLRGQAPFMQKNLPKYAPPWIRTVRQWAQSAGREVTYALCDDRRTLLWFANQRAVEYHPALVRTERWDRQTHLILDIDPPAGSAFGLAVQAAYLVRQALDDSGLAGAVKTSGAKGLHVIVPLDDKPDIEDVAAATRALAGRAARLDKTGTARCSSTPPGRAAPPWWRFTARGSGRVRRCRSPCRGTSSAM